MKSRDFIPLKRGFFVKPGIFSKAEIFFHQSEDFSMEVGIFGQSKEKLVETRIVSKVGISSCQSGDFLLSEDMLHERAQYKYQV